MSINYGFYETRGLKPAKKELMVRAHMRALHDSDYLARLIQGRCTLTTADVKAVLSALSEVLSEQLLDSNRVFLEGLGTFSVSIGGDIKRDKNGRPLLLHGHVRKVLFRPANELMDSLSHARFTTRYTRTTHSRADVTDEEVFAAVEALSAAAPFFTIGQFAARLGLTDSTARRRLKPLLLDGTVENVGSRAKALYRLCPAVNP